MINKKKINIVSIQFLCDLYVIFKISMIRNVLEDVNKKIP